MSDKKTHYPVISIEDEHAPSETVIHVKAASKPVEDDELVEALEISRGICDVLRDEYKAVKKGDPILSPMTVTLGAWNAFNELHRQIARLQAVSNPWIKISDMPEEWKDGRSLDIMYKYIDTDPVRITNCCYLSDGGIFNPNRSCQLCMENVRHAMLPPAPPQQKETQ